MTARGSISTSPRSLAARALLSRLPKLQIQSTQFRSAI
jgi:hypothetical protein